MVRLGYFLEKFSGILIVNMRRGMGMYYFFSEFIYSFGFGFGFFMNC